MMKSTLINAMKGFVLGSTLTGGITLLTFTGMDNLESIKTSVQQYTDKADEQVSALLGEYNVTVDNANAEIGEYKVALQQANDNISQLITAYEDKVDEMEQAQASAEQDLADLQAELDKMKQSVDSQYQATVNQLNGEIQKANEQVAETKTQVETIINGSGVSSFTIEDHKEHLNKLDITEGKPTVQDISSIVPTEEPSEQQGE